MIDFVINDSEFGLLYLFVTHSDYSSLKIPIENWGYYNLLSAAFIIGIKCSIKIRCSNHGYWYYFEHIIATKSQSYP